MQDYGRDPRVVSNLIDGINRTRDDTHMWLAPYTPGGKHWIKLTFDKSVEVAMVRIWVGVFNLNTAHEKKIQVHFLPIQTNSA